MVRKLVITVEEVIEGRLSTTVQGAGFSNLEILGILEEVKADVLDKAKSKQNGGMPASLAALLGAIGGGDGDSPFLRNRPSDDED